MNLGLVVPGFSADTTDWCIPALRHFARALASDDPPRIFALRYPYRADRYAVDGAEVIAIGGAERRGVATFSVWQRTLRTIAAEHRRRPFDVLHAFWATESGLLTAIAGRLLRVPVLVSLAGGELVALPDIGYGDQRKTWERTKIAVALRLASAVSAGSHYLVRLAQQRARRRAEWLPLGVDTAMFQPLNNGQTSDRLLHVGTLTPVKDQRTLLAAFAQVHRRHPRLTLDIVGDGPLRAELQELAHEAGLNGAVRFHGAVEHAQLPRLYQSASVFVLSSRHEAQGMVALEAASCGLAVIGTSVGNIPELAPSSSVAVADPGALAHALELRADECGEAARRIVETTFAIELSVQRFQQCYARLAA